MSPFRRSDIIKLDGENFLWVFPIVITIICTITLCFSDSRITWLILPLIVWGCYYTSRRITPTFDTLKMVACCIVYLLISNIFVSLICLAIGLYTILNYSIEEAYPRGELLTKYAFKEPVLSEHASRFYAFFIFSILSFFILESRGYFMSGSNDDEVYRFTTFLWLGSIFMMWYFYKKPDKYDALMIGSLPFMTKFTNKFSLWIIRKTEQDLAKNMPGYTPGQRQGSMPPNNDDKPPSDTPPTMEETENYFKGSPPPKRAGNDRRRQQSIIKQTKKAKEDLERANNEREKLEVEKMRLDVKAEDIRVESKKVDIVQDKASMALERAKMEGEKNQVILMLGELQQERKNIIHLYNEKKFKLDKTLQQIAFSRKEQQLTNQQSKQFLDAYQQRLQLLKQQIEQSYSYQLKNIDLVVREKGVNLDNEKNKLERLRDVTVYKIQQHEIKKKDTFLKLTENELNRKASVLSAIEEDWYMSGNFNKIDAYNKQGYHLDSPILEELERLRKLEASIFLDSGQDKKKSSWRKFFET